ncbi:SMI1/KNR4 family protein [Streptomyces sp. NPDC002057]|uniref:SMI1/KNR4 family protein n=1 Tax=Streptomyces sp. NPDC002057 TaxID=3154664 RepID=UPI003316E9A2
MSGWDGTGVRARIRDMAAGDPERTRFGANTHRYELAPPLPASAVGGFEAEHGVRLPPDYRSFLTEVGDGPAGPAHGLMPLAAPRTQVDEDWAVDDVWREDRQPGRLATPFPLAEPLGGALGAPVEELTPGTLMLAEEGCGMYVRLIVTGPRAGEIWRLDPDWGGFVPTSPSFRTWYADWLRGR